MESSMKEKAVAKLKNINFFAAGLHFLQGVAVLALSTSFSLPISGSYLRFDEASQSLQPASTELFTVQLAWLVAAFFFLSAFFHLFIATVYNKRYNKNLGLGINKARWVEYSISASIMMVAISLLVGIYDAASLLMIFALISIMNLLGLVMEVHNQTTQRTNWLSYYIGCLAGFVPWMVVAGYLWLGADMGSKAPTFVYWIFVDIVSVCSKQQV